ncbi:MAG: hypothetical protein II782_10670, partial [Oscillospiraceae bacterium]|nr:hypothetical protein [Oscillospiraceae bacterium]
ITVEISDTDNTAAMEIYYGGDSYDPIKNGDEVSAAIVRKISDSSQHIYENGKNTLEILCRMV